MTFFPQHTESHSGRDSVFLKFGFLITGNYGYLGMVDGRMNGQTDEQWIDGWMDEMVEG